MSDYNIAATAKDPQVTLRLPKKILEHLALRATENGRTLHVEIAMRLARTLENDLDMIDEDEDLALLALDVLRFREE
ncbi:MAG: Arc family DNA-binding protein [Gammaproteobacteria bacterium]|nr:Arc family DNA-binding protein [Gammaproteobacteria bacterium]